MSETPEQKAMWAATIAARKILTSAKDPRTLLGRMKPTTIAYHAARAAVDAHTETLAHERARHEGRPCLNCGRIPQPGDGQAND